MNEYNVKALSMAPVSNNNFKSLLVTASNAEIRQAIYSTENGTGKHKSRIEACKRELRVRKKKGY